VASHLVASAPTKQRDSKGVRPVRARVRSAVMDASLAELMASRRVLTEALRCAALGEAPVAGVCLDAHEASQELTRNFAEEMRIRQVTSASRRPPA
jgi:hypothetical protein